MNAPLAELIRWRVLECAKHSARLRRALREREFARRHHRTFGRSECKAFYRRSWWGKQGRTGKRAWPTTLTPSLWTIGPRGKLP